MFPAKDLYPDAVLGNCRHMSKRIKIPNRDGYLQIEDDELTLLDSPQVQRLRRIRQLGMTNMVYPGATHTRFEHSLGVLRLADQLAESINLNEDEQKKYRVAALLHDTGHAPFSHSLEELGDDEKDHEDVSCDIVADLEDELPDEVSVEEVQDIIRGEDDYNIVAGAVDADRLDYLERDAENVGLDQGDIDLASLIQFAQCGESINGTRRVVFEEKAIPALNSFFTARISMLNSAYRHPVAKSYERMLEEATHELVSTSDGEFERGDVQEMNDFELHKVLKDHDGRAGKLYEQIINREHYQRVAKLGRQDHGKTALREAKEKTDRRTAEEKLSTELEEDNDVLIKLPKLPKSEEERDTVYINVDGTIEGFENSSEFREAVIEEEWRAATIDVYVKNIEGKINKAQIRTAFGLDTS